MGEECSQFVAENFLANEKAKILQISGLLRKIEGFVETGTPDKGLQSLAFTMLFSKENLKSRPEKPFDQGPISSFILNRLEICSKIPWTKKSLR